jgi:hypothetical protein
MGGCAAVSRRVPTSSLKADIQQLAFGQQGRRSQGSRLNPRGEVLRGSDASSNNAPRLQPQ